MSWRLRTPALPPGGASSGSSFCPRRLNNGILGVLYDSPRRLGYQCAFFAAHRQALRRCYNEIAEVFQPCFTQRWLQQRPLSFVPLYSCCFPYLLVTASTALRSSGPGLLSWEFSSRFWP